MSQRNQNTTLKFVETVHPPLPKNQNVGTVAFYSKTGAPLFFVQRQAAEPNSTATDIAGVNTKINAILVKLRAAGVIAP